MRGQHPPRSGALGALCFVVVGCTSDGADVNRSSFRVTVTLIDTGLGAVEPPTDRNTLPSLPANLGDREEGWTFTVDALDASGEVNTGFNAFARVSVVPGAVLRVLGPQGQGRNMQLVDGHAEGVAAVVATFGSSRLWVEDIGYVPAPPGIQPACSDGFDNDGDVVNDFPNDPGCALADDHTEEAGSLTTGVSQAIRYEQPTIADVQGRGAETPYPAVAVQIKTARPSDVIVTRVASAGFFVTDLGEPMSPLAYNHLFAFNFNTPIDMRVCDRLNFFSGTAVEFFGFTEVSFPSYETGLWEPLGADCTKARVGGPVPNEVPSDQYCRDSGLGHYCRRGKCQPCPMAPPFELDDMTITDDSEMEKLESGMVRMQQPTIAAFFGPGAPGIEGAAPPYTFNFGPDASNCDLNGDGFVDFADDLEGGCSNACAADPSCTDWIGYASRGNYKVSRGMVMMQVNTGTAGGFDPRLHKDETLVYLTGTLRNFSGGSLNWTIETRCADDIICTFDQACAKDRSGALRTMPTPDTEACSLPPTQDDNDAATN